MSVLVHNDWAELLHDEVRKPYFKQLWGWLKQEYEQNVVYPPFEHIFSALQYTSYEDTKVVIVGQDPYHGPGQAHGLSFSVQPGVKIPPSLQNMLKESAADVGTTMPDHGYLAPWAKQGVMMLNTALTVYQGQAASHRGKGWEMFTDRVIQLLNERERPVVFVLWGSHAQAKLSMIDANRHGIVKGPHPSPLSAHRGFFGSKPFSKVNTYLRQFGEPEIEWQLPAMEAIRQQSF
ncbi:uracil-DNA glycosylase [Paenibacillus profundus]|uniref:Uracil-DNA glycosylase n=1 Tax=Paenibacillus profundus TaxID=1173085 RepID=A0ABS8YBZ3_9BACL|nr:uracil-DNA glycosylase [Paenibacillus profundus]MCE5167871.1 uracil-DNA glycosylase [Paenibacillus profundus]